MTPEHPPAHGRLLTTISLSLLLSLLSATASGAAGLVGDASNGSPGTVDLTQDGSLDWVHWGLTGTSDFNRKVAGAPFISPLRGTRFNPLRFAGNPNNWSTLSWTDGRPRGEAGGFPGGIYSRGRGASYAFDVAAGTERRTLRVYLGGYQSLSRIEASLSDGSAPPFSAVVGNLNAPYTRVVTLTFSAASADQTLTFRHTFESGSGNIAIQAATLAGLGNQPPRIEPIGDRSVRAGESLSFDVVATDADGPPPLSLSIARSVPALPDAALLTESGDGTASFLWVPQAEDAGEYAVTVAAAENGGIGQTTEQTVTIDVVSESTAGALSVVDAPIPDGTRNLSVEGDLDWVHWGTPNPGTTNRRAATDSWISDLTPLRSGALGFNGNPARWGVFAWQGGTPRTVEPGTSAGVYFAGEGNGYEIRTAAGSGPARLNLYLGGYRSISRLEARLSDGSAPPSVLTFGSLSEPYSRRVTLQFSTERSGQELILRHILASGVGNVALQAATLASGETGSGGGEPGSGGGSEGDPGSEPGGSGPPPGPDPEDETDGSDSGEPPEEPVQDPPSIDFTIDRAEVPAGETTVLRWTASDADQCTAGDGWAGTRAPTGVETVGPIDAAGTFRLTCEGAGGSADAVVEVRAIEQVTIRWQAPTENEDGSPLTDLAAFRLYYGTRSGSYGPPIDAIPPGARRQTLPLVSGTHFVVMTSLDADGNESRPSNEVIVTVE